MAFAISSEENGINDTDSRNLSKRIPSTGSAPSLPDSMRRAIERLSGLDMGDVRVRYNSALPHLFNAHAITYGNNIYLGPGAEDTLPHEAWHVVQQKQRRIRATVTMWGFPLNDEKEWEIEADNVGRSLSQALDRPLRIEGVAGPLPRRSVSQPVIQRWLKVEGKTYNLFKNLRSYLLETYNLSSKSLKHFDRTLRIMYERNEKFDTWNELRREFEIRSLGYQHYLAMANLVSENTDKWIEQNGAAAMIEQKQKLDKKKNASKPSNPDVKLSSKPTLVNISAMDIRSIPEKVNPANRQYITWVNPTPLSRGSACNYVRGRRKNEFLAWIFRVDNTEPRIMNCYETVLYGAYKASRLFDRDYMIWALETVPLNRNNIRTYQVEVEAPGYTAPRLIGRILEDNSTFIDRDMVNGKTKYRIPKEIPTGRIVVFSRGSHVALCTGEKRPIKNQEAFEVYGRMGHEIIELDHSEQKSRAKVTKKGDLGMETIRYSTIEDRLHDNMWSYRKALNIGILPEVLQQRQLVFQNIHGTGNHFRSTIYPLALYDYE